MSQERLDDFNGMCVAEEPTEAYGSIASYRDLVVWQRSMDVAVMVYEFTALLPSDERFGLVSQVRRASTSIPSNIAEGWGPWYQQRPAIHELSPDLPGFTL